MDADGLSKSYYLPGLPPIRSRRPCSSSLLGAKALPTRVGIHANCSRESRHRALAADHLLRLLPSHHARQPLAYELLRGAGPSGLRAGELAHHHSPGGGGPLQPGAAAGLPGTHPKRDERGDPRARWLRPATAWLDQGPSQRGATHCGGGSRVGGAHTAGARATESCLPT